MSYHNRNSTLYSGPSAGAYWAYRQSKNCSSASPNLGTHSTYFQSPFTSTATAGVQRANPTCGKASGTPHG
jgi:hypothetical protein